MIANLKKILKKKELNILKIFVLLNILMFFLESVSIISIPIFVSTLIDSAESLQKYRNFEIFSFFDLNEKLIVTYLAIFVILIFILKNLSIFFLNFYLEKFLKKLKIDISNNLYQHYLRMPLVDHLNKNPSTLTRNVIHSTNSIYIFINHFINLVRESVAIIVILFLIIFSFPVLSIFLIIFFSCLMFSYLKIIKPKIDSMSKLNNELRKDITQLIFETFNSIKEIKVLMKENFIENFFNKNIDEFHRNIAYFQFNEKLPKIFLELFSIIFVSIVTLIIFSYENNIANNLPQISLIVISIFRFIPAFNSVSLSLVYLKISKPDIENIKQEIDDIKKFQQEEALKKFKTPLINKFRDEYKNDFIVVSNLNYIHDGKSSSIFDLNLKIKKNEILGITGASGAGKSTFFYLMLGLFIPNSGNIYNYGKSIYSDLKNWRKKISYVSQNCYLVQGTISKNIAFNYTDNEEFDINKIYKSLESTDFLSNVKNYNNGLDTNIGYGGLNLSGGEKQRIAISRALYNLPEIIFLDESTNALDIDSEKKIVSNIRNNYNNTTVIIISHRKSTLDLCDKIVQLSNGKFNIK